MSEFSLTKYRRIADGLLQAHRLKVADDTRDMLAKTILQCRAALAKNPSNKGIVRVPTAALKSAARHASALTRYFRVPPARKGSVAKRMDLLSGTLDSLPVVVSLAVSKPPSNSVYLVNRLRNRSASSEDIAQLLSSLHHLLANRRRPGRPISRTTPAVRGGVIAWQRAGRRRSYTYRDEAETLSGKLPDFLRALLSACGQELSDPRLKSAMLAAFKACTIT